MCSHLIIDDKLNQDIYFAFDNKSCIRHKKKHFQIHIHTQMNEHNSKNLSKTESFTYKNEVEPCL